MLSIAPSTVFRITGHKLCIIIAEMTSEMRRGHVKIHLLAATVLERHCTHPCSHCRQSAGSWYDKLVSALQLCFQAIGALFSDVYHQSIPSQLVTNTRNDISSNTLASLLHLPLQVFKPIWGQHHLFLITTSLVCLPLFKAVPMWFPFSCPQDTSCGCSWAFVQRLTKTGKEIQIKRHKYGWPKLK